MIFPPIGKRAEVKEPCWSPAFELVISGQSIVHALKPDLKPLFLEVVLSCSGEKYV